MNKNFSKTFKFGRFSIVIISKEILFFYIGKDKLFSKSIHLAFPSLKWRILISCAAIIFVLFYIFQSNIADIDNFDSEDEKIKNELLLSSKTDYTSPEIKKELTISEHRVQSGENLSVIAKRYGVSIDTICGSNNLRSYDFIRSGVLLKIPNKDGILYKIKKGNRIVSIAKKYRVSLEKIIVENNIKNPDFIQSNIVLFIPDAKPQNIIPGFMWPARSRRITCGYGWRRNPFNRKRKEFHHGLDIRARYEWIKSAKFGKVTYSGWLGGYGNVIVVAHPQGWKTLYAHLSKIIVRKGQYVKQGQTIGRSGNTGRSTGAHLHFEIMKNSRHKNPYVYLKRNRR